MKTNYKDNSPYTFKQRQGDKILAYEEIKECVGDYNFTALVEEDKEVLSLLKNPFIIALKCTIKQGSQVLGIGRANSILSPKNKFIKAAVLYCWNAAIIDGISKTVKILNDLPLKGTEQKEINSSVGEEADLEGRDKPAFYGNEDIPKYASDAQKIFLKKLITSKCKDSNKKEYEHKLESPYLSSFECSSLIKTLLTK